MENAQPFLSRGPWLKFRWRFSNKMNFGGEFEWISSGPLFGDKQTCNALVLPLVQARSYGPGALAVKPLVFSNIQQQ